MTKKSNASPALAPRNRNHKYDESHICVACGHSKGWVENWKAFECIPEVPALDEVTPALAEPAATSDVMSSESELLKHAKFLTEIVGQVCEDLDIEPDEDDLQIKLHEKVIRLQFPAGAAPSSVPPPQDKRYYWKDGHLKWGFTHDVRHLILQLQTLDPDMRVSSVTFIDMKDGKKARAYGLSMSRERWDEGGWLNFKLPGPECLAIWANPRQEVEGLSPRASSPSSATEQEIDIESARQWRLKNGVPPVSNIAIASGACTGIFPTWDAEKTITLEPYWTDEKVAQYLASAGTPEGK